VLLLSTIEIVDLEAFQLLIPNLWSQEKELDYLLRYYKSIMQFKIFNEFKEFAIKGNMIDIAIGVIIGSAFNKVVDVLVKEIFLPPLSFLTDGVNWENKRLVLREAVITEGVAKPEEIAIGYGKLIEAGVDFLIIGFTVFLVVKFMNSLKNKAENPKDVTENTPKNIELLHRMTELMEKQIDIMEGPSQKEI